MLCWDYTWIPCIHAQTQVHTFLRFHTQTCTYHKDESAKTLCQGLTKQQVADLEEAGQFIQIMLLPAHVFLSQVEETVRNDTNTHTHTVGRISWVPVKLRGLSSSFIANGLGWPFWAWTHPSIPRLCASLVLSLTCSLPHHLSRTNTHTHTHTLYTFFSSSGHFCIVR